MYGELVLCVRDFRIERNISKFMPVGLRDSVFHLFLLFQPKQPSRRRLLFYSL